MLYTNQNYLLRLLYCVLCFNDTFLSGIIRINGRHLVSVPKVLVLSLAIQCLL